MKKMIKRMISAFTVCMLVTGFAVPVYAHVPATEVNSEELREITVEVDTYEDFLNYPKNPEYKYTFEIKRPPVAQPRNSICYRCGKQTLTMNNYRTYEKNRAANGCPFNPYVIDHFTTWGNSYDLSCGSCGYRETINQADTYTAYCLNSEGAGFMRTFEVRRDWTLAGGHEVHECWSTWNWI